MVHTHIESDITYVFVYAEIYAYVSEEFSDCLQRCFLLSCEYALGSKYKVHVL